MDVRVRGCDVLGELEGCQERRGGGQGGPAQQDYGGAPDTLLSLVQAVLISWRFCSECSGRKVPVAF